MNILLTGVTGGIGKELLNLLSKEKINLLITAKTENEFKTLIDDLEDNRIMANLNYFALDLLNIKNLSLLVSYCHKLFNNKLDVLINNAGIAYHCSIENILEAELIGTFSINVFTPILLSSKLLLFTAVPMLV